MVEIGPTTVEHKDRQYIIHPRVELITDCMSSKRHVLELLCRVNDGLQDVCPSTFFNELSDADTYLVYRHSLESIKEQTVNPVSLNANLRFLKSHYAEMLVSQFSGDTFIFELVDASACSSSIAELQTSLRKLRENPRIHVWLDYFGVERSNFDLMNHIDFNGVKMSKELFWDFYENDKILLKHMLKMMKSKTKTVVVEGVDSFDKYVFCKEQQCLMQGYFFNEMGKQAAS